MTEVATATGGSLQIRPDQTAWTPEQQAVLQHSGIDDDVTAAELSSFLHLCQRTQLDPFSRQIYLIGRWDNRARRKVFTPQTGIDGYRVIAHRVVAETRQSFGYADTLWCDVQGRWRDVWLSDEPPAAAKVTVLRNGQQFSAVAVFREYAQRTTDGGLTRMWRNMGANQIAKCAEALALRKAFPHDLAGVYTAEELDQADNPTGPSSRPQNDDQWSAPPRRNYVVEAEQCTTADCAVEVYRQAEVAGVSVDVLDAIRSIGQRLRAAEQGTIDDDVVDVEAVETVGEESQDPDDLGDGTHAAAVASLRAWAAVNGVDDIDGDAYKALGVPLAFAPPDAIRGLLAQLSTTP